MPELENYRLARVRQLDAELRGIESQQLCLDLVQSTDPAIRREAVPVAAGLHAAGLHQAAIDYDRQLEGEFASDVCFDGATGKALVNRWAEDAATSRIAWPTGRVDVHNVPATGGNAGRRARSPVGESVSTIATPSSAAASAFSGARRRGVLAGRPRPRIFQPTMEAESQAGIASLAALPAPLAETCS